MAFPYFKGNGQKQVGGIDLPKSKRALFQKEEHYAADPGLIDAVNVSLLLGQPLLLTGEPGTGKTQLANYLAWELDLDKPLKFETKSTSTSDSLFYTYDALKRFQHSQSGVSGKTALDYITYNALGKAILFSQEEANVSQYLPSGFRHPGQKRSVVLIDEIDKAPRDFPNDILNEIEQLFFRISELNNEPIEAHDEYRPIIIITSNSEKDLPDAFLRRCIFYNIPFQQPDKMKEIVANRLGLYAAGSNDFLERALDIFYRLRDPHSGLRKKPATAELLDWVMAMKDSSVSSENPFESNTDVVLSTISCLTKTTVDQEKAIELVKEWMLIPS